MGVELITGNAADRWRKEQPPDSSGGLRRLRLRRGDFRTTSGRYFFSSAIKGRDDIEQIARDAVVGELEDGRLGVLVHGDDGLGALHADDVLNRAGDAEGEIELRCDGLPGAADLPIDREPAVVADRTGRGESSTQRLGQFLDQVEVLGTLDATSNQTIRRRP